MQQRERQKDRQRRRKEMRDYGRREKGVAGERKYWQKRRETKEKNQDT